MKARYGSHLVQETYEREQREVGHVACDRRAVRVVRLGGVRPLNTNGQRGLVRDSSYNLDNLDLVS